MVRVATIGTNFIVDWFLEGLQLCENVEYVGTYSRSLEKAKEFGTKYGAKLFFDDLDELAKCHEIDAVYIASPNSEHFKQAMKLIENGKHVLIEKTIASNEREIAALIEAGKRNNVVVMEAMKNLHDPGFKAVEQAIASIGPIRRVSFQYCQYSSRYNKFKNGIIENAFDPKFSNGALTDIGVYCVEPMVKLFGAPKKIKSMGYILPDSIDGEGTIICEYDGMLAELLYSKITNSKIPSQIQGEKGCIIIKEIPVPRNVEVIFNDGYEQLIEVPYTEHTLQYELETFAKYIEEKNYENEYLQVSLESIKIMDEARRQQGIVFPADNQ